MAKLDFKDLIFKYLKQEEPTHNCTKVHPKMSHKEWMNTEPVSMHKEDYKVKFATKPGEKIAVASYKDKEDAEKFKKDVLTKGGKAILTQEDAPANATGTAVAGTGDDSSTVVVKKKDKEKLQDRLMRRMKIKEAIDKAIPDLEYPKDEIREKVNQLKQLALGEATPDPITYGPDKVNKAMKIAVKSDGNYSNAVREIEKIAKDLSKVSTIARALKTANEDKDLVKEYSMGLQVPSTSYMKGVGDLNKGKPLRKAEMTNDVIPQGEMKPLKKKNEVSTKLKGKVLDRKIKRFKSKFRQNLKDRKP